MALTIPQALKRIDKIMNKVEDQFVQEGSKTVRSKTPVRTGKLQNGWSTRSAPFGKRASIDNNVEYANFVENGSPTVRPHKMAAQTVQTLRSRADNIVKKAVR